MKSIGYVHWQDGDMWRVIWRFLIHDARQSVAELERTCETSTTTFPAADSMRSAARASGRVKRVELIKVGGAGLRLDPARWQTIGIKTHAPSNVSRFHDIVRSRVSRPQRVKKLSD
jgi:hypothetical protein